MEGQHIISGKVTGVEDDLPLIGVNITVKDNINLGTVV